MNTKKINEMLEVILPEAKLKIDLNFAILYLKQYGINLHAEFDYATEVLKYDLYIKGFKVRFANHQETMLFNYFKKVQITPPSLFNYEDQFHALSLTY